MSVFSYSALIPAEGEIRLIRLHPVQSTSIILDEASLRLGSIQYPVETGEHVHCSIIHVPLHNAPEYTALSYTWGSQAEIRSIMIDGAIKEVGLNLELALRHLRLDGRAALLWIDALCIDQKNEVEKSEQVQRMKEIYSRAKIVVSWLGPATEESNIAMDWIESFGSRSFKLNIGATSELQAVRLLSLGDAEDLEIRDLLKDLHHTLMPSEKGHTLIADCLGNFFARQYWKRVWIIQEIAMASEVVFRCGDKTLSEEQLHHAMRLLRNFMHYVSLNHSKNLDPSFIQTGAAINLFKARRLSSTLPLIYLLRMFGQGHCSDPRDKVFGVLGTCSDVDDLGILVDYRKSKQQIYTETARAMLTMGIFDFMLYSGGIEATDMPSWVPDWMRSNRPNALQQRAVRRNTGSLTIELQPAFRASGDLKQPRSVKLASDEAWDAPLIVSAIFIGKIARCGTIWKPNQEATWLKELLSFATQDCQVHTDIDGACRASWRTAVADQDIRRGTDKPRMSVELIEKVHALLKDIDLASVNQKVLAELGISHYGMQLKSVASGRRPVQLSNGAIGIAGVDVAIDDVVGIILGATVPVVLRKQDAGNENKLIGEAYIHGFMDAEGTDAPLIHELMLT